MSLLREINRRLSRPFPLAVLFVAALSTWLHVAVPRLGWPTALETAALWGLPLLLIWTWLQVLDDDGEDHP